MKKLSIIGLTALVTAFAAVACSDDETDNPGKPDTSDAGDGSATAGASSAGKSGNTGGKDSSNGGTTTGDAGTPGNSMGG